MKCFVHFHTDAVASCKHRAKGVCSACAIDTGDGVACSEPCAHQVRQVASFVRANMAATAMNRGGAVYLMPAFFIVMGFVIGGETLLSGNVAREPVPVLMGGAFTAMGVALVVIQTV